MSQNLFSRSSGYLVHSPMMDEQHSYRFLGGGWPILQHPSVGVSSDWDETPPRYGHFPTVEEAEKAMEALRACVRETSDREIVDLTKALSPAPSYATLGAHP